MDCSVNCYWNYSRYSQTHFTEIQNVASRLKQKVCIRHTKPTVENMIEVSWDKEIKLESQTKAYE